MEQKTEKIFVAFEIISFELVVLDTRFYWEKIVVFRCQYVKKMCQDFKYY